MRKVKRMKPSAILCSDLHIQENQPICRLDNFMEAQKRKHKWLKELQEELNVPILCSGDIFNHWKPSPYLLGWCLRNMAEGVIAIPGQHDLPAHNLQEISKSGIQVLSDAGKIDLLTDPEYFKMVDDFDTVGYPWGCKLCGWDGDFDNAREQAVAIIHYGVYESKPHYPGAEKSGGTAKSVIKKMSGYDLIVSGDNHLSFTCKVGNQLLVNPGSFMRTTAAQADFKPSVYIWYAETNEVERVFVPIENNVISREHIDKVSERDERLNAFISRLDHTHSVELGVSFKRMMRSFLDKNEIHKSIKEAIWLAMEK